MQPAARFGPSVLGNPASAAWPLSLSCIRPGPGIFSGHYHFIRVLLLLAEAVYKGTQVAMYTLILLCLKRHVSHVNEVEQSQKSGTFGNLCLICASFLPYNSSNLITITANIDHSHEGSLDFGPVKINLLTKQVGPLCKKKGSEMMS